LATSKTALKEKAEAYGIDAEDLKKVNKTEADYTDYFKDKGGSEKKRQVNKELEEQNALLEKQEKDLEKVNTRRE